MQLSMKMSHRLNIEKRKQNSLLTNFGFISKKFNQENQIVGQEAGLAATANIHAGPSSD